jgi:hypothetical protein
LTFGTLCDIIRVFQKRTKIKIKKTKERTTMKLTKVLRAKVEAELNEKRQELNKLAQQDYFNRQQKATDEVRNYLKTVVVEEIQKILTKYNMDTDKIMTDNECYNDIIDYRSCKIRNAKEWTKINDEANDRYKKMCKMIGDFEVECELGVEKTQFFEALASICSKFENETK